MYNFIDLFLGIGGFRLWREAPGMKCVFNSGIDKHRIDKHRIDKHREEI